MKPNKLFALSLVLACSLPAWAAVAQELQWEKRGQYNISTGKVEFVPQLGRMVRSHRIERQNLSPHRCYGLWVRSRDFRPQVDVLEIYRLPGSEQDQVGMNNWTEASDMADEDGYRNFVRYVVPTSYNNTITFAITSAPTGNPWQLAEGNYELWWGEGPWPGEENPINTEEPAPTQ